MLIPMDFPLPPPREKRIRSEQLNIRMTEEDIRALKAMAFKAQLTVADFVRWKTLGPKPPTG